MLELYVFTLDDCSNYYKQCPLVSPQPVIESVRYWMQHDISKHAIQRVIFSSKTNSPLMERIMRSSFPLFPLASCRASCSSYSDIQNSDSLVGPLRSGNEIHHIQNGTESFDNEIGHVQSRIKSLQGSAVTRPNLEEKSPSHASGSSHQDMTSPPGAISKSLPGSYSLEYSASGEGKAHSTSPIRHKFDRRKSVSEDMVLNPGRTESDV